MSISYVLVLELQYPSQLEDRGTKTVYFSAIDTEHAEKKMGKFFASIISLIVTSLCYLNSVHALSPVVMIPGLAGSVIKAKLENAYVVVFSPPLENDSVTQKTKQLRSTLLVCKKCGLVCDLAQSGTTHTRTERLSSVETRVELRPVERHSLQCQRSNT